MPDVIRLWKIKTKKIAGIVVTIAAAIGKSGFTLDDAIYQIEEQPILENVILVLS